ncbi:MAG: BACON domain-containing protein [Mucinivorans sp.]
MTLKFFNHYALVALLSLLAMGCRHQPPPTSEPSTAYTISFCAQDQSRLLPLQDHEKVISSVFVALYDIKGQLLSCHRASSSRLTLEVPGNATTLYAIANVLSNSTYEYYYDNQLIDFGGDMATLRSFFATLGHQGRITLRHRTDGSNRFVAQNRDPLPMCAQSPISKLNTSILLPMRLMVARLEIQNPDPKTLLTSIMVDRILNRATLQPHQPTQMTPLDGSCSIVSTYATPTAVDKVVYYVPESWGRQSVTITTHYLNAQSQDQSCESFFLRLLGGKYYVQSIFRPPSSDDISLSITSANFSFYAGQTTPLTLISTLDWRVESKPSWVQISKSSSTGSALPNELTLMVEENRLADRVGQLLFSNGSKTATLELHQTKLYDAFLVPASDYMTIPARSVGFSHLWNVNSSTGLPCMARSDVDWIHWTYSGGLSYWATDRPMPATFTYSENKSREARHGTVQLYQSWPPGSTPQLIDFRRVTQLGATDFLSATPTTFASRSKGETYELTLEHSAPLRVGALPSWVTLKTLSSSNYLTRYALTIARNDLPAPRQASVDIEMDAADGPRHLSIALNQAAAFTQSYPFKLQYSVVVKATARRQAGNVFVGANGGYQNYANTLVFYPSTGGETGQINRGTYGLVQDPPYATTIATSPISDDVTTVNSYGGAPVALHAKVVVTASSSTYFRNAEVSFTIPSNLTVDDKLLITIEFKDVLFFPLEYTSVVKYDIL